MSFVLFDELHTQKDIEQAVNKLSDREIKFMIFAASTLTKAVHKAILDSVKAIADANKDKPMDVDIITIKEFVEKMGDAGDARMVETGIELSIEEKKQGIDLPIWARMVVMRAVSRDTEQYCTHVMDTLYHVKDARRPMGGAGVL